MIYTSSLACANQLNIEKETDELMKVGMNWFHIDFMDGHCVPNLCLNLDLVKELRKKYPTCILDAHLMVTNPNDYIERCAAQKVDYFSVIPKTCANLAETLDKIAESGMKRGIILNLDTEVEEIEGYLPCLDIIVVMSIVPGNYGVKFDERAYDKIAKLAALKKQNDFHYVISVDGGVNVENGRKCRELGAEALVTGVFAFFKQEVSVSEACARFSKAIEA